MAKAITKITFKTLKRLRQGLLANNTINNANKLKTLLKTLLKRFISVFNSVLNDNISNNINAKNSFKVKLFLLKGLYWQFCQYNFKIFSDSIRIYKLFGEKLQIFGKNYIYTLCYCMYWW